MAKQFTLGKHERVKSRKLIEQLFKEGKSFVVGALKVYYLTEKEMINAQRSLFNVQFGVGVSAKLFKKAVDRNRIKRVIRETWRLQKNSLQVNTKEKNKQLSVFFIYNGKKLPVYSEVFELTGKAIAKLQVNINK